MRIGTGLGNQTRGQDPRRLAERAVLAEHLGFASVATIGRIAFAGVMDTVALAVAAGATTRVGLLAGVLVAPAWGPTLLAKELASIDAASGHRLTVGIGIGSREDDYPDGRPVHRGRRLDRDVRRYKQVWAGDTEPIMVPAGTRQLPVMFGGVSAPSLRRMATEGVGFIGPSWPAEMVAPLVAAARAAWSEAGRRDDLVITALTYSALSDPSSGVDAVRGYYRDRPSEIQERFVAAVSLDSAQLQRTLRVYRDLGVDEVIVNPAVVDEAEYSHIAASVL